jgi:hypothetical protein
MLFKIIGITCVVWIAVSVGFILLCRVFGVFDDEVKR